MSSPIKTKLNPMLVALLVSLGFALTPLAVQAQIPAVRLQAANYNATSGLWTNTFGPNAQASGTFPTLSTGVTPNGSAAVVFNGANYLTLATAIPTIASYTAFVYVKPNAAGGTYAMFGGAPGSFEYRINASKQEALREQQALLNSGSSTLSNNVFNSINATVSGTGGSYRFNGGSDGATASSGGFSSTITTIGARAAGNSGQENFNGSICEILIYTNVLTAAQITNIENALTATYVTASSAPAVYSDTVASPATNTAFNSSTLYALIAGTGPISYQWQFSTNSSGANAVNVAGATNSSLTFATLDLTNAGYYSLQASNAVSPFTTNSSWVQLTVLPLTPLVQYRATNYNASTGVWTDSSGNGNNATYSGGTKPTVVSIATPNGSSAINFTAANQYFSLASTLSGSSGYTVFAYVKPSTTAGRNALTGGSAGGNALEYDFNANKQNYLVEFVADKGSGTANIPTNVFSSVNLAVNSSGAAFRLNGASDGNVTGATFSQPIARIGGNTGAGDNYLGLMVEIAIYSGVLNAAAISNVEAQLTARYVTSANIVVSSVSPATNTVAVGGTATFSVSVGGTTVQQWLSNGVPILGATNLSYTTPATTASYNGTAYQVVVTNAFSSTNVVTSSAGYLVVRSTPGIVTFDFPTTTTTAGGGTVTDPGVSIAGTKLLAGDTVVFDGIVIPNGSQADDAWTAIDIQGGGYGGLFGSTGLAVLTRLGAGANPSQLFINGSGVSNPTSGSASTNRVRIELYPSVNGSTTNMGWVVKIDQNLSGTFQTAVTGTNKTFINNTLPLTFGSSGNSAIIIQDPQSPVSVFAGPYPATQIVATNSPASFGVTVKGWSPTFQWLQNGTAIANATNRTYTLTGTTLANNGDQFSVVVSNQLDSLNVVTSSVATLSVVLPIDYTWNPTVDFTTWDTAMANWTTNAGVNQTTFTSGHNAIFDATGYFLGGSNVTVNSTITPNLMTVSATSGANYLLRGSGGVSGQTLHVTGDGTGTFGVQSTAAFNTINIDSGSTLDVGYAGTNGTLSASTINNNGTIGFLNTSGTLSLSAPITGTGNIIKSGGGNTVLSATNSTYGITSVNAGVLSIASTPNAGAIVNNAEIQPASAASVLTIPNAISGTGHFFFTGFQTTVLTGVSSFTGVNTVFWSDVIVDNAQALGDTTTGKTVISGADRFGGLYLSNNITWSQPMQLDTRYTTGAAATAPHVANVSGTNTVTSALTFATGSAAGVNGTNVNVEVTAGQLTIDATSTLANNANSNPNILNLQGAGTGIWNGVLANSSQPLSVTMRGTGTWTLGGTNTYTGNTTISAGTLALSGNGQITNSTKIILAGGTTLDVSAMNSPFALGSSQTLSNSTSTAVLAGNAGTGSGTVSLTFASGTPALSETNGTLTLSSSTTFKVNNTGSTLALGSYKIIATNTGGFVAGTLPTPTVSGAGALAGHPVVLSIVNSELYLVVTNTAPTANFLSMGAVSGLPVTLKIIGGKHAPVDPDGDAVTVTAVGAAGNGTTSTDGTNVTYTASGSFTGSDSFTYTVTDTYGATATASVTVTVVASGEGFNKVSGPTALGGGDFRLTFLGVPGYSYALDWTGSLTPPVTWTPQLTNAADTNGFLIFTNNQVGSPNFWRTRNVP